MKRFPYSALELGGKISSLRMYIHNRSDQRLFIFAAAVIGVEKRLWVKWELVPDMYVFHLPPLFSTVKFMYHSNVRTADSQP